MRKYAEDNRHHRPIIKIDTMRSPDRHLRRYNDYLEEILLGKLTRKKFNNSLVELLEQWEELDLYERARFLERFERIIRLIRNRLKPDDIREAILAGQNHGLSAPFHNGREIKRNFRVIE